MKRTAVIFITGALLFFLTACGAARWERTPILEGSRATVNLEYRVEKSQIVPWQYEHPYQMPIENMTKLLGDLVYAEKSILIGGNKETPVFQAIEIATLAPALTDALAKATPDQRVQFTSFNKGGGFLFKNTRKTEGVLFVKPKGRINLAFNMINADAADADSQYGPQIYTNTDPLKIKYADTALVPNPLYAEMQKLQNGNPASMWIIADAAKLQKAAASLPKPEAAAPAPGTATPPPVMGPQPETRAVQPSAAPAGNASPSATNEDIKNKLKYLKELYDGGLISEPEYTAEKKKLLKKIE
ncbi:MAG: hypothetical protein M0Z56_09870 [Desulfobacteraceae bacterium]|nr:hypothetical protein [Desulfobacteraceae bacterium]